MEIKHQMDNEITNDNKLKAQLAFLILLFAWLIAYSENLSELPKYFWSSKYNLQSMLAIVLMLLFSLLKREELAKMHFSTSQTGLILLFILNIFWGYFYINDNNLMQYVCVLLMLPSMVLTILGWKGIKVLLVPTVISFFVIPIGDLIAAVIPKIYEFSFIKLWFLSDLYKHVHNNLFISGTQTILIKNTITGLLFTPTIFMITLVVVQYITKNELIQILTAAFTIIISFFIIYIFLGFYLTFLPISHQSIPFDSLSKFTNGIIVICFIITLSICFYLEKKYIKSKADHEETIDSDFLSLHWLVPIVISYATFIIVPISSNIYKDILEIKNRIQINLIPPVIAGWEGPFDVHRYQWFPDFQDAEQQFTVEYNKDSRQVMLYTAYYGKKSPVGSLSLKNNQLFDPNKWKISSTDKHYIDITNYKNLEINEYVIESSLNRRIIWYWYYIGRKAETDIYTVEILESIRYLTKAFDNAGVIAIATDYPADLEYTREFLTNFLNSLSMHLPKITNPKVIKHPKRNLIKPM